MTYVRQNEKLFFSSITVNLTGKLHCEFTKTLFGIKLFFSDCLRSLIFEPAKHEQQEINLDPENKKAQRPHVETGLSMHQREVPLCSSIW